MTLIEMIDTAEEPYRTQMLENCTKDYLYQNKSCGVLRVDLLAMFTWKNSPQGEQYWVDYHKQLIDREL